MHDPISHHAKEESRMSFESLQIFHDKSRIFRETCGSFSPDFSLENLIRNLVYGIRKF